MTTDEITLKSYLNELYQQTGGDVEKQASMHDVGIAIGLDKSAAGSLAEELMVLGQVELKTLSGGIGITAEGMALLGISSASPANSTHQRLSDGPVVNDSDREFIETMCNEVQTMLSSDQLDYTLLEEIVMDFKTIEVQMLSPKPKTTILKEIFRSMQKNFEAAKRDDIAANLSSICK